MTTFQRILGLFQDSPTYGRDRANLITGFSVGVASLLLNAAVLLFVGPLMLSPDDQVVRTITNHLEFGQLLALILLGGAATFATLLIPLRQVTVFWEPRIGRYFDQIVLSGITPLRFMIGKATSQNLFLMLILFLLLPYFVLCLTLGRVHLGYFVAGLFLVWLYCMVLALVMLWVSLYMNELLAAWFVISAATLFSILGCLPWQGQLFFVTPFPALIQPVYASIPQFNGTIPNEFLPVFAACTVCMTGLICLSLSAIYLGPLYGIIRENSTFGEVVREGDSKKKRWFRIRMHIQRSSEVAFFYQNRSRVFLSNEGLIRWGFGFLGLVILLSVAHMAAFISMAKNLPTWVQTPIHWLAMQYHCLNLTIHGFGLSLAIILYSHAKNTTYVRIPFLFGKTVEISRLDTFAFLLFLTISTATSIALPFQFEKYIALPMGKTIFPAFQSSTQNHQVDFTRTAIEGAVLISFGGLVVSALHRYMCLMVWMRSVAFVLIAVLYTIIGCTLPCVFAVMFLELQDLRNIPLLEKSAPIIAMISPSMSMYYLTNGELGPPFPNSLSTIPFYASHIVILGLTMMGIRRQGRKLREKYLTPSAPESG